MAQMVANDSPFDTLGSAMASATTPATLSQMFQAYFDYLICIQCSSIGPQAPHTSYSEMNIYIAFSNHHWVIDSGASSHITVIKRYLIY